MKPLNSCHVTFSIGNCRRMSTQSNTRFTRSGGFFIAFRFWMSLGLMESSAASAASSAGCALARSASASAFWIAIAMAASPSQPCRR